MKLGIALLTLVITAGAAQQSSNRLKVNPLNSPRAVATKEQSRVDAADQISKFIRVDGPDLKGRMDAAIRRARSESSQSRFWIAYGFDVRPGIAIDASYRNFNGSINKISDSNLLIGTDHGERVETRNLGVFLLHDKNENSGQSIVRAEIYNLERSREYSGYPVYWLDRADNRESIGFLKNLADTSNDSHIADVAVAAIGAHDDPSVGAVLKDIVRTSTKENVRSSAVFWMGQAGGEEQFLASLVQNDQESREIRKQAAFSIGVGKSSDAMSLLHSLYESVKDTEVRKQIIFAFSVNEDKQQAAQYIGEIALHDGNTELRKQAIFWLSQTEGDSAIDQLSKIYDSDQHSEIKEQILFAYSQIRDPRARTKLYEIARSDSESEIRKKAIFWIGQQSTEEGVSFLSQLYSSEQNQQVKENIIFSLSQMRQKSAIRKMIDIAKNDPSVEMKKKAIFWLGQSRDPEAMEFFKEILK